MYKWLNCSMSTCSVIITISRNSASLSASPTAWFTSTDAQIRRWRASFCSAYSHSDDALPTVSAEVSI